YTATLTARTPGGTVTSRWPLLVFEIEHITDSFGEGKPRDYARLVRDYDRAKLGEKSLRELAYLLAEGEDAAAALVAGKDFVARLGKGKPAQAARMKRLIADCTLRLGQASLDEAVHNYQESL